MEKKFRELIKDITPPVVFRICRRIFATGITYVGPYDTWADAMKKAGGYDSDIILAKVRDASIKVRDGKAVCERDSVLFGTDQYSYPVLAGLLKAALAKHGGLKVLDFGGALGSSYYQCRKFFKDLKELRWNIIEQEKFVDCGKELFESDELKFYYNIKECFNEGRPEVALLSAVVQYLEDPYELLNNIEECGFEYIIFDRTAFVDRGPDRLMVQTVPSYIYKASYPVLFFNKDRFLSVFDKRYKLLAEFDALAGNISLGDVNAIDKGFIFVRK